MSDPVDPTPPEVPRAEFWRRTPPAVFPAFFGLFGLGLALRATSEAGPIAMPLWLSDLLLLVVVIGYVFAFSSYVSKISTRPGVVFEDLASPPGRAGGAAMTLCLLLLAATLIPFSKGLALGALFFGLVAHACMTVCAVIVMLRQPMGLMVTPAWHLSFVGFILAPLSAVPLGFTGLSVAILCVTFVFAIVIYAISLFQILRMPMPAPQRPLLVIHLAPVSLFTTVSFLLGWSGLGLVMLMLTVAIAATLASRVRYLTEAGISPVWGAFTFPVAACATALLTASSAVSALGWLAWVPLLIGLGIIPFIAASILLMWRSGQLAQATGAGIA